MLGLNLTYLFYQLFHVKREHKELKKEYLELALLVNSLQKNSDLFLKELQNVQAILATHVKDRYAHEYVSPEEMEEAKQKFEQLKLLVHKG